MSCTVFEKSLARVWPIGGVADSKRAERAHAFATSNGWAARIHDIGTRVVFKKLATQLPEHDAMIRVCDAAVPPRTIS